MNKLEKPVKGKNIKYLLDAFFNKYVRKHFNEVHSIDFIISDLGERMDDGGRNIKILRNDNPVRTNNPDWFPPKAQQTDHICTFLKQLMDNNLGTKDSYVGLKVDVVSGDTVYTWDVKSVDYYASSGTVILRTEPRQGITIECPAIVKLYINPLLTSKAVSSIIYNSIVTSESKYNFILGERNIHKGGDNVWIFGKNNVSRENNHNSLIDGYNNDVDSYGNLVIGDNNNHRSYYGATIGQKIKNFKKYSYLFGEGHDNGNGAQYGTAFGKYSKLEADTLFAIGDGTNESNRHNLFELKSSGAILDKDGNDIRNSGGSQVQSDWNENDNTKPTYIKNKPTIPDAQVQADWNETDNNKLSYIKNKPDIISSITEITWSNLISLKGRSMLIPGAIYKITDYKATTIDPESRSTDSILNILIKAIDKSKFDENAVCSASSGNWQIKYCIDNDTDRFAWADSVNGKGVIYWMKDDKGNEFPYDAYNIEFKRYKIIECENIPDLIGKYATKNIYNAVIDENDFMYKTIYDNRYVYNNIIKPYFKYYSTVRAKQYLNNIIMHNNCYNNIFNENCNNITLLENCTNNIFGMGCNNINLFDYNKDNVFKNYCNFITSSNNNMANIFGNKCSSIIINGLSTSNTFGDLCYTIRIGYDCKYITIEHNCDNIQIKRGKLRYITIKHNNHYIDVVSTLDTNIQLQNFIILSNTNISDTIKVITHNISRNNYPVIYKSVGSQEVEV